MSAAPRQVARRAASGCVARADPSAVALALTTAAALCLLAGAARADVVTLLSVRDNTLYESSAGELSNGAGARMFAGRTAQVTDSRRRALVRFDLPGPIPAGSIVTNVVLRLTCDLSASNGTTSTAVCRVLADWGEGTSDAGLPGGSGAPATLGDATWHDRFYPGTLWTSPGGDFIGGPSAALPATPVGTVTIGSTSGLVSDVQGWLDNPGSNFGWILLGDESKGSTANRFDTRESGAGPTLVVTYLPPATPAAAATWGRVKGSYR